METNHARKTSGKKYFKKHSGARRQAWINTMEKITKMRTWVPHGLTPCQKLNKARWPNTRVPEYPHGLTPWEKLTWIPTMPKIVRGDCCPKQQMHSGKLSPREFKPSLK